MLVIRLARGGRTKYPTYRIVAAESARAATGKYIEILGNYNPHTKELTLKKEEIQKRISHGAQPSNSVVKLLQRENVELPAWVKLKTKAVKVQEPEATEETETPAADEPTDAEVTAAEVETPAEEATEATDEVRVASAATENAAETADKATPAGATETTETTEAAADAAVKANEAPAEVADDTKQS